MKKTFGKINKSAGRRGRPNLYIIDTNNPDPYASPLPKKKRPGYLKIFAAVLGLYLLFSFLVGGYQVWQLKKQIQALESEQKLLLEQQNGLKEDIQSLNNAEIIERIARESLGMVKPGETVIIPAIPDKSIPKTKILSDEDIAH